MTRFVAIGLVSIIIAMAAAPSASTHESRPAYLELVETEANQFNVFWKVPAIGTARLKISLQFPKTCNDLTPRIEIATDDARVNRWSIGCTAGLASGRIEIAGIEATLMDALVRISTRDGRSQTLRLSSSNPSAAISASPTIWHVAQTYFAIGVEHILFGIDHLLFVLTLLLLAGNWRRLFGLITFFTAAHSITLAAATLGHVSLPSGPVEALIAFSIVLAAAEYLRPGAQRSSLIASAPWIVAFSFGLLHGFGFAGALAEVGLPQGAIPPALLFFNIGVEAGQILFVIMMLAAFFSLRSLIGEKSIPAMRRSLAYGAGSLAAYWFIERALIIVWA